MIQPMCTVHQKDNSEKQISEVNTEITSVMDSTKEGNKPLDFYSLQCCSIKMVHGTHTVSETTKMRVANL